MAEEKMKKAPKPPELFKVHSLVRDVSTRLHRAKSPTRHRFSMLLGGGLIRVTRKRPATVTKELLLKMMPELLEKEGRGVLLVTNMINQRLDLNTLSVVQVTAPTPPLPSPPLDTASTDNKYPVGELKPTFVGGLPETAEVESPEVVQRDLPEGKDEEEDEEEGYEEVVGEASAAEAEPALVTVKRKRGRRR